MVECNEFIWKTFPLKKEQLLVKNVGKFNKQFLNTTTAKLYWLKNSCILLYFLFYSLKF